MLVPALVVAAVLVLALVWFISIYNRLVRLRNLKEEGWSDIDVQLKRRHDLVGNLVNTVKGYMTHERGLLEEVARCRSMCQQSVGAGPAEAGRAEGMLTQALGRLFAVMENYPDLKAHTNSMHLQTELSGLEEAIQMARRYYNGTVRDLNTAIELFPSNMVASMFRFAKAEYFELDNVEERQAPVVQF